MVSRLMCADHMPTLDEMESFLVCQTLEYPAVHGATAGQRVPGYEDPEVGRREHRPLRVPSTSELLGRNPTPMRSLLDRFRREDPLGP